MAKITYNKVLDKMYYSSGGDYQKFIEKQIPKKIVYQKSRYGSPWLCPECDADQAETKFFSVQGEVKEKYTFCWNCGQKLDWDIEEYREGEHLNEY